MALGHHINETILSCAWKRKPCDEIKLAHQLTSLGKCVSINDDGNATVRMTGAEYGMRLTLNLQQYEHVKGFNQNAGFKVHLRSQLDVPNVKNQGFAVSANTHALVGCKYTITTSLGRPYGNCSQKTLLYDAGPYSKQRCVQECLMKNVVKQCGCRRPDTIGTDPVCDMPTYLNCTNFMSDDVTNQLEDISDCECPDNCTIVSHSIELSTGQISQLSSEDLIGRHKEKVQDHFLNALDTRHRIEPERMVKASQLLVDAISSLAEFASSVQTTFHLKKGSDVGIIIQATEEINNLVHDQVNQLLDDVRTIRVLCRQYIDPAVRTASLWYKETANLVKLGEVARNFPGPYEDIGTVQQKLNDSLVILYNSLIRFNNLAETLPVNETRLPTLDSDLGPQTKEQCRYTLDHRLHIGLIKRIMKCNAEEDRNVCIGITEYELIHYRRITNYILSSFNESASHLGALSLNDTYLTCLGLLFSLELTFDRCHLRYTDILDSTLEWLLHLKKEIYDEEISLVEENKRLHESLVHLDRLQRSYLNGSTSKLELANGVLAFEKDSFNSMVVNIVENITRYLQPLEKYLGQEEERLITQLLKAFTDMEKVQSMVPDFENITQRARTSPLWRQPDLHFDSPQVIYYKLSDEEVRSKVWPRRQSLSSFLAGSGKSILARTIRDMFSKLRKKLL